MTYRALLIGNSTFGADASLNPLNAPTKDVARLHRALVDTATGLFDDEHVRLVTERTADELLDELFALFLFRVGQIHDDHQEQALAAQGLGDEGQAGHRLLEGGVPADVVGQLGIDLRVLGKRLNRVLGVVEGDANPHLGSELVGLELELGDGAEVAAATVQGPEEVGVLGLAGGDDLA